MHGRATLPALRGVPLVVDLDGTLTPADVSLEAFVCYARRGVLHFLRLCLWLLTGRAVAKAMVARHAALDPEFLPLRPEVVALIQAARVEGRPVILASASHSRNIGRVSRHCGLFDRIIATRRRDNLKGAAKLRAIRAAIGEGPFDYVGDSRADRALWKEARRAFSVGHLPRGVERLCAAPRPAWRALLRAMRPHQWAKNALVFVPLLTAGLVADPGAAARAGLMAVLFSLLASGVYLLNDLLDIEADRQHATKKTRPLASGELSIPLALLASAALMLVPFAIGWAVLGWRPAAVLGVYLVLTTAYSFRLKAVMSLDVVTLASLYTLRIAAGAVAIGVPLSFWLLTFSIFLFLSLAYLKRYTELAAAIRPGVLLKGRGYTSFDLDIVAMSGVSAGMVSILVLALFIHDVAGEGRYAAPELLWPVCLILLYWINRTWLMARRGEVEGDPVAFAIKDRRSLALGGLMAGLLVAAQFVPLP